MEGTDRINLADVEFVGFNSGQTIVTTASLAGDDPTTPPTSTPPTVTIPTAPVAPRGLAGTNLTEGADSAGFSNAAEVIYGLGGNDDLVMAGGDNPCCRTLCWRGLISEHDCGLSAPARPP